MAILCASLAVDPATPGTNGTSEVAGSPMVGTQFVIARDVSTGVALTTASWTVSRTRRVSDSASFSTTLLNALSWRANWLKLVMASLPQLKVVKHAGIALDGDDGPGRTVRLDQIA